MEDKRGWAGPRAGRAASAGTLCLMALAVVGGTVPGAAAAQSKSGMRTLRAGGLERSYLVHLPAPRPAGRALPLVLVFHGAGGRPRGIADHTGFSRVADREGFIAVYPAGIRNRWNDGRGRPSTPYDDVAFIRAMLDTLLRTERIDPARIYATGISNGAMFVHRLACELPGVLAAIAPVAGALPAAIAPGCAGAPPVSVLAIQGTEDQLVPYDGGGVARTRGAVLSARESVAHWARRAGCGAAPVAGRRVDRVQDGTALVQYAHAGCGGGSAIELYEVRGGGHTWPGGPRVTARLLGRTTRELDGTRAIWDFFAAHPRGAAAQR